MSATLASPVKDQESLAVCIPCRFCGSTHTVVGLMVWSDADCSYSDCKQCGKRNWHDQ